MVARVASRSQSTFHGARLFDPIHDLGAVAHLLEEAFRPEHTFPLSTMPVLREVGVFLWTMSYAPVFPEMMTGFVWVEDGRIVGNVTLNPGEGRLDRYMITNVAVKPSYRRQGIARALMQAAIDHLRTLNVKTALLNVRPNNPGTTTLYRDLGFAEVEMRGEWARPGSRGSPQGMWHAVSLRPLRASDNRIAAELVRAATPANVQKYHAVRNEFSINWDDRLSEVISDFF
ncbi:MAG: GNAT family N-acetyltransferase, partial [Chloroflexota bacterium]|nr:GNAT family N-acetyltransferase [Chloroflexota bacterium]